MHQSFALTAAYPRDKHELTQAGNKGRLTMSHHQAIFPHSRHALYEAHRYSAAIRSGDLLFVSGQVGSRDDGTPEPDFAKQVELAFANLMAVLAAAGCELGDVVDVTTFHTDPEAQLKTVMAALSELDRCGRHLAGWL
jgi:enamine deaminase RidA (YjgF/YER057c/UK114 family)